ncbi:lipoprotein [Bordetella pertussis]|nr:lipoprotein [Bordetella pertussis]
MHEAAARAAAGTLDPDAPVYDPNQATPASQPSPWNTPNAYPGMDTP